MKKQTYTYQNFNRQNLYARIHTSLYWAIKSVEEINKRIRENYENGVISRSELDNTVIGFIMTTTQIIKNAGFKTKRTLKDGTLKIVTKTHIYIMGKRGGLTNTEIR